MIPRILLALSFTAVLSAQPADLVAHVTTTPYDETNRINAVVEVETIVPLRQAEVIKLDILGSFIEEAPETGPGIFCVKHGDNWLECNVAQLPAGSKATVKFRGAPMFASRNRFVLAKLEWRDRGFRTERRTWEHDVFQFVHEYVVTHTGDSGPGSLREAIEDAKANCKAQDAPCLIRFDAGPAATIRPLTPLPDVTAIALTIDGQARVTLDGSLLTVPANGLVIGGGPSTVTLRGLAITGFPENGVELTAQQLRMVSCVVTANGSRGVAAAGGGSVTIEDSVLSGNGRSGVFLSGGYASIVRNLIGVAADGVTPMPNGASGIYAGNAYWATIQDNVIAYNAHFGVALPRTNRDVDVMRNRIVGNRAGQIDVDLDGPSFFPGQPSNVFQTSPPNGPTMLTATYDPATNSTTVTGRQENVQFYYFLTYELFFYATTAANEADQYLGGIHITQPDFSVTFPGDLRGRFITANTIRWVHDEITDRGTSELAAPIEVR